MSTILKSPKRLKDLECKNGQLTSRPPIPYLPLTDLITTKKVPVSLKIKLSIFSYGNTMEYLAHIITVLCLINQKGLNVQCKKLAKIVDKVDGMLEKLQEADGTKGIISKDQGVLQAGDWADTRDAPRSQEGSQ
jgi:hypothetical protein